jgi:hypothetical protein
MTEKPERDGRERMGHEDLAVLVEDDMALPVELAQHVLVERAAHRGASGVGERPVDRDPHVLGGAEVSVPRRA